MESYKNKVLSIAVGVSLGRYKSIQLDHKLSFPILIKQPPIFLITATTKQRNGFNRKVKIENMMANERNSSVEQHIKTTTPTLTTALHTSYTTRLHISFIFTPKYGAKQP